jgi:hypothetical protein
MNPKVQYVERVLGFVYEQGFARKFEEVGSPDDDLDVWYRNAQVYEKVTCERPLQGESRHRLVTLIESIRLEAMSPPLLGEPHEFDLSAYEFSEDVLSYKEAVVHEVLRQEAERPSFLSAPEPRAWRSPAGCRELQRPNPSVKGTSCGKPQAAPYVER